MLTTRKAEQMPRCRFCTKPAEGNYSIHRDGFCQGPAVPLCDACGQDKTPTVGEIWARIAKPKRYPPLSAAAGRK